MNNPLDKCFFHEFFSQNTILLIEIISNNYLNIYFNKNFFTERFISCSPIRTRHRISHINI